FLAPPVCPRLSMIPSPFAGRLKRPYGRRRMRDSAEGAIDAVAAARPTVGNRWRRRRRWALAFAVAALAAPLAWPDHPAIPVQGATRADWNPRSFWYYPWGASGVHKGIDIFAPEGRPVLAATSGLVIRSGFHGAGGNMIAVLGP